MTWPSCYLLIHRGKPPGPLELCFKGKRMALSYFFFLNKKFNLRRRPPTFAPAAILRSRSERECIRIRPAPQPYTCAICAVSPALLRSLWHSVSLQVRHCREETPDPSSAVRLHSPCPFLLCPTGLFLPPLSPGQGWPQRGDRSDAGRRCYNKRRYSIIVIIRFDSWVLKQSI